MATVIINKKKLIELIESKIADDHVVIITTDVEGEIKGGTKRRPSKIVPVAFHSEAFSRPDTVGDIAGWRGAVNLFGVFTSAEKELFSDEALEHYKDCEK